MEEIHVFGHKNPDTDSICATLCYANLKSIIDENHKYTPNRLGELNRETAFVLEYFGVEPPEFLPDMEVKLKDLTLYNPTTISKHDPVKDAIDILDKSAGSRIVPIVDKNDVLEGVVSIGDITKLLIDTSEENITLKYEILFDNFLRLLDAEVKYGSYKYRKIEGRIIIGSIGDDNANFTDKDVIITTRIKSAMHYLEVGKCGCIIIANSVDVSPLKGINDNIAVVPANKAIFTVVNLINQAVSISSVMNTGEILMFSEDSYVEDTKSIMKSSAHRNFPVIGDNNVLKGVISRRHLIEYPKKKAILVDHNERSQSVDGIGLSDIVEIIDHHRVADIQTDQPLYIRSEPLGSSCSIVYKMYIENHVAIDKKIAGLLLSAIISDTLVFNSPTCTPYDKYVAYELSKIAEIKIDDYAKKMFEAGTNIENEEIITVISADAKAFNISGVKSYVSQINTLDIQKVIENVDLYVDAMNEFCTEKQSQLFVLMVTDIINAGSYILCVGEHQDLARTAFAIPQDEKGIYLPGVVSRKKQVIPKLMNISRNISFGS